MKILLKKSEDLDDWYTIVRAEHDGKYWMDKTEPNIMRFMCSERLSPEACIEGPGKHMIALATAIRNRGIASFKRCAVHFESDGVHFHSPRNSVRDAIVTVEDADGLAEHIFAELTPNV